MRSARRFADARGKHDHQRCMSRALRAAEQVCAERGLRLTPIRKHVLELIWKRHAPIGAYDILSQLSKAGGQDAPPTVYRALSFLLSAGLIHRIDTLNAYLPCETPEQRHTAQLLVCRSCRAVTELGDPAITRLLSQRVKAAGFTADARDLEIKGLCGTCRAEATTGTAERSLE
ncbi:MAG TPA: Fur family transcriptional regulator [Steroidobacteraceae bacterium]|nr:Fur family transcriptional regulator [Steroidobacteraceae bacterium]HUA26619.1 Fur family transcriptional regulator [Steroidobacteraceae bacterium]